MEDLNFENFVENLKVLKENPKALEQLTHAMRHLDVKEFNMVAREIRLIWPCRLICRWVCFVHNIPWYRVMEVKLPEYKVPDLIDVTVKLHSHPDFGSALMDAHRENSLKPIDSVLERLDLGEYRHFVYHWCHYLKCTLVCWRFCYYPYFF